MPPLHNTKSVSTPWKLLVFILFGYVVEVIIMGTSGGIHSNLGKTNRIEGRFESLNRLVRPEVPANSLFPPRTPPPREGVPPNTNITQVRAVIVVLCRNSDLPDMIGTMITFETRFNRQFRYPYVFLNNVDWSKKFRKEISALTTNRVQYGVIAPEEWAVPPHINLTLCEERMQSMKHVMYGQSLKYRQMCRYYSGYFYRHPLVSSYEYYWRVEPGTRLLCNLHYDPFLFMKRRSLMYGFVVILPEIRDTVPTLVNVTMEHVRDRKISSLPKTIQYFFTPNQEYNLCHFWSNFEIGSFVFLRSNEYDAYFTHLDNSGGFFYERWGDAPVHSLAAGLFLQPHEVHYFDDIGYEHPPFNNCPVDAKYRNCDCENSKSFARMTPFRGFCSQRYSQVRGEFNTMATIKDIWD